MHTPTPWVESDAGTLESEHRNVNGHKIVAEFYGPDAVDNIKRVQACTDALARVAEPAKLMAAVNNLFAVRDAYDNGAMPSADELNPAFDRLRTAWGTGK